MAGPEYPKRTPEFPDLPPDVDGAPEELDNDENYTEAGETDAIPLPAMRAPVDVRVSKPAPVETKTA